MKILMYRGKSIISKLIRFQTRSQYSHVAVQLEDTGSVIESWHKGGVRRIASAFHDHTIGTPIDVYTIDATYDRDAVKQFLYNQVGKKYDFGAIARFLSRRHEFADNKWFCSELCLAAFEHGGLRLLNGNPSELSPRDVALSPILTYEKTIGG